MMILISKGTWSSRSMMRKRLLRRLQRRIVRLDAGDGVPRPEHQQWSRRGLVRGTKRSQYKLVAPDARTRTVDAFSRQAEETESLSPLQTKALWLTANGVAVRTAYGYRTRPYDYVLAPGIAFHAPAVDHLLAPNQISHSRLQLAA